MFIHIVILKQIIVFIQKAGSAATAHSVGPEDASNIH